MINNEKMKKMKDEKMKKQEISDMETTLWCRPTYY